MSVMNPTHIPDSMPSDKLPDTSYIPNNYINHNDLDLEV